MRSLKKCAAALLFLLCLLPGLAACQPGDPGYDLTIMGKKSDLAKTYMTRIFDLYEQETGNKIKLIAYEDQDFEAEAARDFAAGKGPDIFLHFNNADLNRFDIPADFCYLNDAAWVDELTDSARAYCEDKDGNLLGLPFWESSLSGCYYNKTILDSLGLKPAATQAEFDVLCQVLADAGLTPLCWPADGCSWMVQFALDPVFADHPERLAQLNAQEIAYADIPEVKSLVEWVSNAAANGWFGSDYLQTGWDQISPTMSSGKAVMTFIWDTWFYTDFQPGKYTVDDFALMPVFLNTAEAGTYEGGNLNMMMVNKNAPHPEAALDFLAFCAEPAHYNAAFAGIATVSCFNGETTNIQSNMVTNAAASIAAYERVSTAATRIVGYSADEVAIVFDALLNKRVDVDGCVALLDQYRLAGSGS